MTPNYDILPVNPLLQPYIRRYLITDNQNSMDVKVDPTPTGYNYLGWVYRGDIVAYIDGEKINTIKSLHLAGQIIDKPFTINYLGKLGHVLAEFTATGFYQLMHVPGHQVNAKKSKFMVLSEELAEALPTRLNELISQGLDYFDSFEQCLIERVKNVKPVPKYVPVVTKSLEDTRGRAKLTDLYDSLNVSERQVTRNFSQIVGISPKKFACIMRLNHVLELIYTNKSDKLTNIAQTAGFYDQSHLIHVIQQYFGENPQQFVNADRRLYIAFHTQISTRNV